LPAPISLNSPIPALPSTPKSNKYHQPPKFSPSKLGKLADHNARVLKRLGWRTFFQQYFHHKHSSLSPHLSTLPHPASPYLHWLASSGVPIITSQPPWTMQQQNAAIARGPHPSAAQMYSSFLLEDMYDYVRSGYWLVLPYHTLCGHPHLKIAPSGVVLQRECRPRPIMDYSYNIVNQHTIPLAPPHAMQFGAALPRILQKLAYANPAFGPPLLAKIDLSNGYYCVPLSAHAALQLAVVLPPDGQSGRLLGIPLSLPMGWSESPPYFCSFTETCTNLTNHFPVDSPSHPYKHVLEPQQTLPCPDTFHEDTVWPYNPCPPTHPVVFMDSCIDDFMIAAQWPQHTPC